MCRRRASFLGSGPQTALGRLGSLGYPGRRRRPIPDATPYEASVADKKTETQAGEADPTKNKMEAMRQSLAELGDDAPPLALQAHMKERFGHEMTTKHISTYRGDILKKRREQKAAARKVTKKPTAARQEPAPRQEAAPVAASNGHASVAVKLEDILAVRSLVDRVGARHLRTLIAAFER